MARKWISSIVVISAGGKVDTTIHATCKQKWGPFMKQVNTTFPLSCLILLLCLILPASAAAGMDREEAPDEVFLNSFSDVAVAFDHQLHVSYAACVECHHHTTGDTPSDPVCNSCHRSGGEADSVACRDCHARDRFGHDYLSKLNTTTRYHIDIPGLKGAYHLSCMRCHEAIGTGPTACGDCHPARKIQGPVRK